MAWSNAEERTAEESNPQRNSKTKSNRKGCTSKKCIILASILIIIAGLVAAYVALICQRMDLAVINATATGLKAIRLLPGHHNATSHHMHASLVTNASAPAMSPPTVLHAGTSNATVNASYFMSYVALNLSLLFSNPTPSMGTYHYHPLQWQLSYRDINIANGSMGAFSKSARAAFLPMDLQLIGTNITLPPDIAIDLRTNLSVITMHASTTVKVYLVKKLVDFEFPVSCNMSFPHPGKHGETRLPAQTSCQVKAA